MLFLLSFISVCFGITGIANCNKADIALFRCVDQLVDTNHDGVLTPGEISLALQHRIPNPAGLTLEFVMQMDYNLDGVIDMVDWSNSTRRFYKDEITKDMACFFCRNNGVNMDLNSNTKKSVTPQCSETEDSFLNCVYHLFDLNNDQIITREELTTALKEKISYNMGMTVDSIMRVADFNKDGFITKRGDWDHPDRKFYTQKSDRDIACIFCQHNGITM
jgi:hypothetical protein